MGTLAVVLVTSLFLHLFKNPFKNPLRAYSGSNADKIFIEKETPDPIKPTRILILGDMMFDRGVRSQINSKGFEYVFGPATTTFAEYDKVIANLEGPITSFESKTVLPGNKAIPGFQFTFPADTASALKNAGIDIVSLANNHAYNFGKEGLGQTKTRLSGAGVQFFGSPENNTNIATSTCIERLTESGKPIKLDNSNESSKKEICIGFVGWHEFGTKNYKYVLDEIVRLRPRVDYLIVFPHWGVEYEKNPTVTQIGLAHEWLNAGADAVIGAHPHVVQKIERYKTTDGRVAPIFYSLGNFIFDQYFSFDTTHGVGVEIEFNTGTSTATNAFTSTSTGTLTNLVTTYKLIPFSSTGSRVSFPNGSSTMKLFNGIESVSNASGDNLWEWLQVQYINN
jgi:poly-gamma-glutamate synthesis protein (capsule biosynthesis protein)